VALNFMVSAAVSVNQEAGGETELKGKFCTANGAFTQWFIVQSDYWVLVIALCTYAVFRPPGPTSLLRRALPYLLHLPYTLSLLQSILGATLVGYVDVGSWCWFGSDKIRFLWNYTQRISIGLVITAIYVKLWTVLRRGGCDFGDEEVGVEERVIGETEISSPPSLTPSRTPLTSSTCPDSNLITPSANCSTSQPRRTLTSHQDFRMLLYPVAYLTIWILPTACRIYAWSHGHHVGYGWGVAEKSMICLSGAINSVVYWMNGRVVGAWVGWV
ncbi:hypothetical protein SAICODRAFT_46048, partial [Saitoella complicata NRRL Y-17804]|uniref:uncharacterized protein n=1 Tax=Saitoella complicata (strain BCRC 22490 / CBS 7301 / JCM 7358 / NBRC 10748 / NRRL Y-17804) TaxID=698492 RepID=UPI00086723A0